MRTDWGAAARRLTTPSVGVGALVAVVATFLFSRFELYSTMIRDSSIYIYGGQQVLHGLPPYASEMDPKGPMSSLLASAGVAVARLFGRDDVIVVRCEFCLIAVVGVVGIYLLVLELTRSITAGAAAAVTFLAFRNYAYNALVGTDGHMPGIVFMIFALWLTARKSWYWAGFAAALAFLTWQPLFVYPAIVLLCALLWSPVSRLRSALLTVAGAATPFLALVIYYLASGYLSNLFDGLVFYPLTGVQRPPKTLGHRLHFFATDIKNLYADAAILFWAGLILIVVLAVWQLIGARSRSRSALDSPVIVLLLPTMIFQLLYVCYDYIGYPHSWPLIPYAACGIGLGVAAVLHALPTVAVRRGFATVLSLGMVIVVVVCAVQYSKKIWTGGRLRVEQAGACGLERSLAPGTPLWTIDDPVPLVLLHRRQPDNYPYVGGGLDIWKVNHTTDGFAGWMRQLTDSRASIVVYDTWVSGKYKKPIADWLRAHGFRHGFIGVYQVYVNRAARTHMRRVGLKLASRRIDYPVRTDGTQFRNTRCR